MSGTSGAAACVGAAADFSTFEWVIRSKVGKTRAPRVVAVESSESCRNSNLGDLLEYCREAVPESIPEAMLRTKPQHPASRVEDALPRGSLQTFPSMDRGLDSAAYSHSRKAPFQRCALVGKLPHRVVDRLKPIWVNPIWVKPIWVKPYATTLCPLVRTTEWLFGDGTGP